MVVSNIIGGLGNQMFQYAAGLALSLEREVEHGVSVDMFDEYPLHHGYELDRVFGLRPEVVDQAMLRRVIGWRARPVARRVLSRFSSLSPLWGQNFIAELPDMKPFSFHQMSADVYLHGYWQSERFFGSYSDRVRSAFHFISEPGPLNEEVFADIAAHRSASVHIRRGDYLSSKNSAIYSQCRPDYYLSGMKLLQDRVGPLRFFIFSDDPDWAGAFFDGKEFDFRVVSHNSGASSHNDMRLMSACDHHVIANSTFSWWGAWLNPNLDKIVIAPRQWMYGTPSSSIVPDGWIRL